MSKEMGKKGKKKEEEVSLYQILCRALNNNVSLYQQM